MEGPIAVYLNDHLGGAAYGSDLAKHVAGRSAGTPMHDSLEAVASQIEVDRQTLSDFMDRTDTAKNPIKQAVTWIGEKATRAGLALRSSGEEHFGLFLGLEALTLGVEGKASLWSVLQTLTDRYPELGTLDLPALEARARSQQETIEAARLTAARLAFAGESAG
jgi:hypothetical protein